jgi:hypothetical protein
MVERWLLDWELQHFGAERIRATLIEQERGSIPWYEPDELVFILFPPTRHAWQVPAFVPLYAMQTAAQTVRLLALMRDWQRQCGAEVVVLNGTMLGLYVSRPPTDPASAWDLALQHALITSGSLR